jgi:hypothetical protein
VPCCPARQLTTGSPYLARLAEANSFYFNGLDEKPLSPSVRVGSLTGDLLPNKIHFHWVTVITQQF